MAMEKGSTRVDWTQEEFVRLAHLVLESVAIGGTVMDACQQMEKETSGLRSSGTCRYKWNSILSKQYAAQYEMAKKQGQEAIEQSAKETIQRIRTISEHFVSKTDDVTPTRMTQRQLIRFLRGVEIVDDNVERLASENELLRHELEEVKRERDELSRQLDQLRRS